MFTLNNLLSIIYNFNGIFIFQTKLKELEDVIKSELKLTQMIPPSQLRQKLHSLKKNDSEVATSLIELQARYLFASIE